MEIMGLLPGLLEPAHGATAGAGAHGAAGEHGAAAEWGEPDIWASADPLGDTFGWAIDKGKKAFVDCSDDEGGSHNEDSDF